LSAGLARRAVDAGLDVRATYRMTETASQVTTTEKGEIANSRRPRDDRWTSFTSASTRPIARGTGEIVVAGSAVFDGYFDDDAATREASAVVLS
jgi:acyl-CoA synthetase (AMP-forming)/AMP-acid ligase II